jgi:bacterioferritin-associated ferredoxin
VVGADVVPELDLSGRRPASGPWRPTGFRDSGEICLGKAALIYRGPAAPPQENHVIVCHCRVVNDAAVVDAVEAGATTLAQVCRVTGAGTDCGSCVFSVKALLCQHDVNRTALDHEVPVATGHSSPEVADAVLAGTPAP